LDQNLPVHEIADDQIEQFCAANTTNSIKVIWIGNLDIYKLNFNFPAFLAIPGISHNVNGSIDLLVIIIIESLSLSKF
jgi:hypothetical protein